MYAQAWSTAEKGRWHEQVHELMGMCIESSIFLSCANCFVLAAGSLDLPLFVLDSALVASLLVRRSRSC